MAAVNLIGSYNYALVALSVLIAMFASYAALDLAGRVTAASGWTRAVWLLGGAAAMGTGIWSMHYIGMLAFILPIPVAYHWPTVLLSLFAAIFASVIALYVVSRQKMDASRAVAGSVLMGAGIASMHYIGMAAMRLPAICQFNSFLVVLSVVFAVSISLAALWITFHFRDEKTGIGREKLAGAVVMGAAIPIMHYTGVAAASFTPSSMTADLSHAVNISTLGTAGIASVTFVVLGGQAICCADLGTAGREAAAKRGVLGGGAEAHAHRELGVAGSGKGRLASVRGMVPRLWLQSRKWPAVF